MIRLATVHKGSQNYISDFIFKLLTLSQLRHFSFLINGVPYLYLWLLFQLLTLKPNWHKKPFFFTSTLFVIDNNRLQFF